MSDEFERWMERNVELGLAIIALVGEQALRNYLNKKHNILLMPVMLTTLLARLGVEATGMYVSYLIDGKNGMDAWLRYSDRMFDDYLLVPNPVSLVETTGMSLATIGAHYIKDPRVTVVPRIAMDIAKYSIDKLVQYQPKLRFPYI